MTQPKRTTALISRLMSIDLPYYSQWLEHYDSLGVDAFYLIYIDTELPDLESMLAFYPKEKIKKIVFVNSDVVSSANDVFKQRLFDIKEDYLLHVDSDEFVYLNGLTLPDFIEQNSEFNYFRFQWLMIPACSYNGKIHSSLSEVFHDIHVKKYFVQQYKSMVLYSNIDSSRDDAIDIHDFKCVNKNIFQNPQYFILHFSFRSTYDAYLKCKFQKLMNKNEDTNRRFFDPHVKMDLRYFPTRFLVYEGEINNANPSTDTRGINFNLTSKTDIKLLLSLGDQNEFSIFWKKLNDLHLLCVFSRFTIKHSPKIELLSYFQRRISRLRICL
jgi:hypothetical protein